LRHAVISLRHDTERKIAYQDQAGLHACAFGCSRLDANVAMPMMSVSLLCALLSFSPPGEAAAEPPAPSVQTATNADPAGYADALARVRTAQQMANDEPERGVVQLRDALQFLQEFGPTLAKDPEGQDARTMGQLTLARALLAIEDADGAREAMDEAIRTARGDPLPVKSFGPGLTALYRERSGVLAKQTPGEIAVECLVACRVYINERPTQQRTDKLIPGSYRVWVEATDGSEMAIKLVVDVAEVKVAALKFGTEPEQNPDDGQSPRDKPKSKRIMPRWAEIMLMSAGAVAIGTGATLWAIHHQCPDFTDPLAEPQCPRVYLTKTAGIATVAAGGLVFLTGTVMLTVDEVRIGQARGNTVALNWTLRF
jgi:hypothetical protein